MFAETLEENMVEERWAPGPSNSPSQGQGLQNPDPLDSYMGDGQPSTTFEDAMGLGGSESDFCSESTLFVSITLSSTFQDWSTDTPSGRGLDAHNCRCPGQSRRRQQPGKLHTP
jgi:hypothetical protein